MFAYEISFVVTGPSGAALSGAGVGSFTTCGVPSPSPTPGPSCAAGEEVPLGVQIETALMDAFPPRYVGDQTRAHPELERTRGAFRRGDETHQTKPSSIFSDVSVKDGCTGKSAIDASLR